MDVNGDGKLDVLSGSYSRHDQDMAGLFQVLHGEGEGRYRPAEVLKGTDGEPLLLPRKGTAESDEILVRICTRPTAVDFDGDGHLDIVSGNFEGTFYLFKGEGAGKYSPQATPLVDRRGKHLRVDMHSDPVFFDWDGDGDQDLFSGSAMGGVMLAKNVGTPGAPAYDGFVTLLPGVDDHGVQGGGVTPDDSHLIGPGSATRVWVDDVNGDGKADLLVGDSTTLILPAEGVSLEEARERYAVLKEREAQVWSMPPNAAELSDEEKESLQQEQMKRYEELDKELKKVVDRQMTGFVWVYHRK